MDEPIPVSELMQRLNALPKWKKFYYSFYRNTIGRISDAYYKYLRNWNWCSPIPRGFNSRHGYSDTPELIEGHVFGLFMRYYEGEYLDSHKFSEKDYEDLNDVWKTKELVDENLKYQKFVEDTAKWIVEVWDKSKHDYILWEDPKFHKEVTKRLNGIIKYRNWMWT